MFGEECYSEVEYELGGDLMEYGQFLEIDHLLVDLALVFVDAPVLFLAVPAAVVDTLAVGTE